MITRRKFGALAAKGGVATMMINSNRAAGASGAADNSALQNGYHMGEETEPHLRTFMQWPVNVAVHPDRVFLSMLQSSIARIANTIVEFEPVVMLMDKSHQRNASKLLSNKIEIWDVATDDLWARDSGPIFVQNSSGDVAISQVNFNGWGNKQVHVNDGKIAQKIAERLSLPLFNNGIVGEAGGIEADGHGTLIAHESSWVNSNRNAGSRTEIGNKIIAAFGARKIIWAPGIKGQDITDYHIDSLARFVRPGTVAIQLPEVIDHSDRWSKAAFATRDILAGARDARGEKIKLVTISEPYENRITSKDFLASYVNYYVCNGALIAAQFGDEEKDAQARAILETLYPEREVITLNIDPIGEVGGGIHCATQQQPA